MILKKALSVSLFFIALSFVIFYGTVSFSASDGNVVVEEKNAPKDEAASQETFINAAISTTHSYSKYPYLTLLPMGLSHATYSKHYPLFKPERFKEEYPWLYEYLYRDEGLPKSVVINKWVRPVTVSLGFPDKLRPASVVKKIPMDKEWPTFWTEFTRGDVVIRSGGNDLNDPVVQVVEAEIKAALLQLSETTGLSMKYIPSSDDTGSDPARIRIVIVGDGGIDNWKTKYKRGGAVWTTMTGSPHTINFRSQLEDRMWMVPFTPDLLQQVDGYYIPNAQNAIDMAFCYIWKGHETSIIKALIRECLIRSMGIPDSPKGYNSNYLAAWNADEEHRYSEEQRTDFINNNEGYTAFDLDMLKMLYSPKIKPGMDPVQAYRALTE